MTSLSWPSSNTKQGANQNQNQKTKSNAKLKFGTTVSFILGHRTPLSNCLVTNICHMLRAQKSPPNYPKRQYTEARFQGRKRAQMMSLNFILIQKESWIYHPSTDT